MSQFEALSHFVGSHSPRTQSRTGARVEVLVDLFDGLQVENDGDVLESGELVPDQPGGRLRQVVDDRTQLAVELKASQLLAKPISTEFRDKQLITYLIVGTLEDSVAQPLC